MITRLILEPGQIIRVTGPSRARVVSGQVLVLGAIFNPGDEFVISKYRSYAVKGLVESVLELDIGHGGSIENPLPGEEVIDQWVSEIDRILRKDCKKVVIIGPSDSGKTSIAALIANRGLLRGYNVGIIDADVGQADVGPPATVSASLATHPILWLRELRAQYLRFIGSITPQRYERRILAAVIDLFSRLEKDGADVVIVDTDGWVQGINAIEYKVEMARFIQADAVVVLGDELLYSIASQLFRGLRCGALKVPTPAVRRERSREDRRELRREAYRRYLEPLYERRIDLEKVSIYGSCFFSGKRIYGLEKRMRELLGVSVLAVSETQDTYYVVTDGQPHPQRVISASESLDKQVYILDINIARNALISIIGEDYEEKAIGLLEELNFSDNTFVVATPYTGDVKGIIFGGIRLSDEFEEVGKPLRCVI